MSDVQKKLAPRLYSTSNPGGVGHAWYRAKFVTPFLQHAQTDTRFIPARVTDNPFTNPDYQKNLEKLTGWQKRAWLYGDWDIAAGQFFTTFRREAHVISKFDPGCAVEWFAAMDYGFSHFTVVLLACVDSDGNIVVVDEHAERQKVPQLQAPAIRAMFARHGISLSGNGKSLFQQARDQAGPREALLFSLPSGEVVGPFDPRLHALALHRNRSLSRFVAGTDVFGTRHDGTTIAVQYAKLGISLRPANMDRINGWAEIHHRLGDPDNGVAPKLFFHERCARLIECLPNLQHDPNRPEDVLKMDPDDDGVGGDDTADALRYLVSSKPRLIQEVRLTGL